MRKLKGASLLEAIVAALVFLIVFALTLELMPRFAIRDDDSLILCEAEYRIGCTLEKYTSGAWSEGEYKEQYEWGEIVIRIAGYRDFPDLQLIDVRATIDGSRKCLSFKQLFECQK